MFYVLQDTENSSLRRSLSVQELKAAETHLLKWSQFYVNEDSLDKKLVAKRDEDGLFRAHGRLEDIRCLPEELRKPIILQKDHPFVILLLCDLHERRGHCGYKSLIHEARKRFWIIGLRRMAKTVTSKCVMQKTTEKASQPARGTDSKPKSSSWLPGILKHCYGHVWASTDQARPQNSERGTSDHLRLHDITCDSS